MIERMGALVAAPLHWLEQPRPNEAIMAHTTMSLGEDYERDHEDRRRLARHADRPALRQSPVHTPDFSMMLATNQELAAGACLAGRCGSPIRSPRDAGGKSHSSGGPGGIVGRPVSPGTSRAALGYAPDPDVHQKVVADLVARVNAKNPDGGRDLQAAFAKYDYDQLYDGIAGPYGLSGNDTGNAMAAYLMLGWLIANGQQDVPGGKATTMAVRAQVAGALSENSTGSNGSRAELGEELKLQFVVAHAGWLSSMRARSGQPYADRIARQFEQIYGIDLRQTMLGTHGFQPRA
jgi:hypothetical protein